MSKHDLTPTSFDALLLRMAEDIPVANAMIPEALNAAPIEVGGEDNVNWDWDAIPVIPEVTWFLDVDDVVVTVDHIQQQDDETIRLAFKKVYQLPDNGCFELIPRKPDGIIQRVYPQQGQHLDLRQRFLQIFGSVPAIADVDVPRPTYQYSEEFRNRHWTFFMRCTHTIEYDKRQRRIRCHLNDTDDFVTVCFGNENGSAYNEFKRDLEQRKVTAYSMTAHNSAKGGGHV